MDNKQNRSIDEYISGFPEDVQVILKKLRNVIKETAPDTQESISYGVPTFKLNGTNLVHFGGYRNHIGFYPSSSPMDVFGKELSLYETSKGTIRFPLDKPIPFALIRKIVKFRVNQILNKDK